MPVQPLDYGPLTSKPFATLGEIAAQREQRETSKLNREIARSNLDIRQRELADKEAQTQAEAQRQQMLQGLIQKHSATGKLDPDGLIEDLRQAGDLDTADKLAKSVYAERNQKVKDEADARNKNKEEGLYVASQLRDVTPETYTQRRQEIIAAAPEAAKHLPEQYDPAMIQHIQTAALTNEQWVNAVNALESQAKGLYGQTLVNLALADTPEQIQEAFAMADGVGVVKRLTKEGITPEAVSQMTPEQRQRLLLRVPGLTPNAILEALKPKAESGSQGSDYGRFEQDFMEAEAAKRGKTVDQLAPGEKIQIKTAARKQYGQADDAARRPLAPIIIQTASGPMVTTGADRSSVAPIMGPDGKPLGLPPTSTQRDRAAGMGTATVIIDSIDELSKKINTGHGALAKITGSAEKAKAQANLNDDVSEYQALISGFVPLLARAVGHTGVLTEQDVQSVKLMLPDPGDSQSVRDRKMSRIRSIMAKMPGGANAGAILPPAAAQAATPQPTGRFNPATGKVEPIR